MARRLFLACLCCGALALIGQAPGGYRKPPKDVLEILNAPLPPAVYLDPTRSHAVLGQPMRYPSIQELAEPMLKLAGLRIKPSNNALHGSTYLTSLKLKALPDGDERPIALPEGMRISAPRWNAKGTAFAFTQEGPQAVELWICDLATLSARRIEGVRLNPTMGYGLQWMPDQEQLLVKLVPTGRAAAPETPAVPPGPKVMESAGVKSSSSTYESRDLLRNAHDADLFDHYTQSQLALVHAVSGKITLLGTPQVFGIVSPSPSGQHLLVERLRRPYSYLRAYYRFPKEVEVWSSAGQLEEKLASLPLAEQVPNQGVPEGPRSYGWRDTAPATLCWVEALDGGNPKAKVAHRDRLIAKTVGAAPREYFRTTDRFSGLMFVEGGGLAIISETDYDKHWLRSHLVDTDAAGTTGRLIQDRSWDDGYKDPGYPVRKQLPSGVWAILRQGDHIFFDGNGASPEGDRPFLDRLDLRSLKKERIFRSDRDHHETFIAWLDPGKGMFITRRQSPSEVPNYMLRTLGKAVKSADGEATVASMFRPITAFADPAPKLRGITKQRVTYKRPDGVDLSFTLYLPPDYKPGTRLPAVFWAYPLDYTEKGTAGQIEGSTKTFNFIAGTSNLFFLLQGYAVMDNVAMPVVGPAEGAYDTFIEQIVANAKAAIDKADELGVIDRDRIGIGGHSHGALMTANLLAHSDLFKAGIARSGAYNHTLRPFGFQNEKRTLYQAKDTYVRLSPLINADKIRKPILLIHGEMDANPGTVPMQSEKLYEALRGVGATTRLVMLPYEDHGYRARESTEHVLFEMINWFDRYVKNAATKGSPTAGKN